MEQEIKDRLYLNINEALEYAYRRGYSHGYSAGFNCNPQEFKKTMKMIGEWRYDLENMNGAPGTAFEDVKMPWKRSGQ